MYIRGRATWGATKPAKPPVHDNWGVGVTLVIHHTAGTSPKTLQAEQAEMRSIQRQHMAGSRGEPFNDIGYNDVIAPSGRIHEGRGFGVRGAHTLAHNTGTIGVSLMGNLDVRRPTLRQRAALVWYARRMKQRGAHIISVRGHRDMPGQATACPGRYGAPLVSMVRVALGLRR